MADFRVSEKNLQPTGILDYSNDEVRRFAATIGARDSNCNFLKAAHQMISKQIVPIYTIRESQPVSATIRKRRGSCSQRLAALEALARLRGVGTRVRGLWISGRFWNRRFPLSRLLIPKRILLAWPQFALEERWLGAEELFGRLERLAQSTAGFSNDGETLFEAIQSTAVDFEGRTRDCPQNCALSQFVLEDAGFFDSRDELFTCCAGLEGTWRGFAFELLYSGRLSAR